jgi:hypothetical protein
MGRLAGAALTVAAPEAKAASKVAGAAGGGGRGRRPITPGMSPADVNGELQSRRVNAKHEARDRRDAAATAADPAEQATPAPTVPPPASPGGGPSLPAMPAAAATGSGFLLGLFGWALGLAYLRGGAPEVKRFMAAKFLNQTTTGG